MVEQERIKETERMEVARDFKNRHLLRHKETEKGRMRERCG